MKPQKFKGQTLYGKRVINNILSVYNQCENPSDWYIEAHTFAANIAANKNLSNAKVCGVIAALSPLKSWDENKIIAKSFINTGRAKHIGVMVQKAKDIVNGSGEVQEICEILNGNKITSFFINMLFPAKEEAVTIDRHAVAVALGRNAKDNELQGITDKQYNFFVDCYKEAAEIAGITPNLMQSATWEKWRELKEAKKFEEVPF